MCSLLCQYCRILKNYSLSSGVCHTGGRQRIFHHSSESPLQVCLGGTPDHVVHTMWYPMTKSGWPSHLKHFRCGMTLYHCWSYYFCFFLFSPLLGGFKWFVLGWFVVVKRIFIWNIVKAFSLVVIVWDLPMGENRRTYPFLQSIYLCLPYKLP